jgi:microcompartment protein CcmL/EutN
VQAGVQNAEKVGELVASHVIARPHVNIDLVLPLGRKEEAEGEMGQGRAAAQ